MAADRLSYHGQIKRLASARETVAAELNCGDVRDGSVYLVDPELRKTGIRRLCGLLSRFGVSADPSGMEGHFETFVNAQHGLTRAGFSRKDLDAAELLRVRVATQEYFRSSNEKLALEFPEFSAYLEGWEG